MSRNSVLSVQEAQIEISSILAKLELATGMLVDTISLDRTEITTYTDSATRHLMAVNIEMVRLPGHQWS